MEMWAWKAVKFWESKTTTATAASNNVRMKYNWDGMWHDSPMAFYICSKIAFYSFGLFWSVEIVFSFLSISRLILFECHFISRILSIQTVYTSITYDQYESRCPFVQPDCFLFPPICLPLPCAAIRMFGIIKRLTIFFSFVVVGLICFLFFLKQ